MCAVGIEHKSLAEYARYVLKEICRQDWVREKFLKKPEHLLSHDLLLDKTLTHKQVRNSQHLLSLDSLPAKRLTYDQAR